MMNGLTDIGRSCAHEVKAPGAGVATISCHDNIDCFGTLQKKAVVVQVSSGSSK